MKKYDDLEVFMACMLWLVLGLAVGYSIAFIKFIH